MSGVFRKVKNGTVNLLYPFFVPLFEIIPRTSTSGTNTKKEKRLD